MSTKRGLGASFLVGMAVCLPVSGLLGQTSPQAPPPIVPPAAKQTPAPPVVQTPAPSVVQTPSTAPLQASPMTLPENALLPLSLNLRAWLGMPTTFISINGSSERFGISTGLNANTIGPATVARLQIPDGKAKVRIDVLDHELDVPETFVKNLQIGLLKLENVPFAQLDVISLLSRAPHPDAPVGWLGTPFLSAFQVTMDLSHNVCALEKPQAKMPAGAMIVPMTLRDGHVFVLMTLPKSKPFPAMVDTGAVLTLIPASLGEKLKLPALENIKLGGAGGKSVPATLIQVPMVSVGKAECKALRVAYLSADASPSFGRETAVLGLDFLSRFKIVLNITTKKLAFVPLVVPESPPAP